MINNVLQRIFFTVNLVLLGGLSTATATEIIYTPTNPTFGGSPLNGSFLLGKAQSQNDHKDDSSGIRNTDPLSRFEETLQRNILNQIARRVTEEAFGEGNVGEGGIYDTDLFSVQIITTNPDSIKIVIENKETGQITEIEVPVFG